MALLSHRRRSGAARAWTTVYRARPGAADARPDALRPWPPSIFEAAPGQGTVRSDGMRTLARTLERDSLPDRHPGDLSRSIRLVLSDPELTDHLGARIRAGIRDLRPDALVGLDLDGLLLATLVARSLRLPVRAMFRGRRPPASAGPGRPPISGSGEREISDAGGRFRTRSSPEEPRERIVLVAGPLDSPRPLLQARDRMVRGPARIPGALVLALAGRDEKTCPGPDREESTNESTPLTVIELCDIT